MEKKNIILICGLNGVGKSTFAKALAKELGYRFVDIEDVYFSKQNNPNYPYEKSRSYDEVVSVLNDATGKEENIVLASVTGHFGDAFISRIRYPMEEQNVRNKKNKIRVEYQGRSD